MDVRVGIAISLFFVLRVRGILFHSVKRLNPPDWL
jgi:hypothetical protein